MTYINKIRESNYGVNFKSLAREKVDKYRELADAFENWCKDNSIDENDMNDGLNKLDGLIEFWEMREQLGETEIRW